MRRPPIVCRRAVQPLHTPALHHIWVSDELLSSTFNRFVRSWCPQQKRHGSHVPGPLEARRRAAKRRMTASANFYPHENLPPSFNLGALFGFRSNPQPSWRYEPPSLQQDAEPLESELHPTAPTWNNLPSEAHLNPTTSIASPPNTASSFSQNGQHTRGEQQNMIQSSTKEEVAIPTLLTEGMQDADAEEHARACVQAFQIRIAGTAELARKTRNTVIQNAFQDCCSASADTSLYTVLVVRHFVRRGCDPSPVLQLHSASSFSVPSIQSPDFFRFLVDMETLSTEFPRCKHDVHRIRTRLIESVLGASVPSPSHDEGLVALVRQLWQSAHLQGASFEAPAMGLLHSVTKNIKNRFRRQSLSTLLSDIVKVEQRIPGLIGKIEEDQSRLLMAVDVLSCLPRDRLGGCVSALTRNIAKAVVYHQVRKSNSPNPLRMHVWLQLLYKLDLERASCHTSLVDEAMETLTRFVFALDGEGEKGIRVLFKALVTCASQTGAFQGVSLPKLSHLLLSIETATGQSGSAPVDAAFDIFLSQLRKHDVSQEGIVQSLLDLIARHAGLKFTVPFLRILRQRRLTLADPASLHQLVANELVAIRESSKVTEKARQHTAYALHICNTVSKLLSNISAIPATSTLQPQLDTLQAQRQLAHILTRAHIDHALPLAYRNVAANISVNDSVNLIHQLAHQYATNNTRTQREAWRAIYYLYRYLQQNSLPIDPLFSKAVVRASIIRPMSENRFVSARRVIWVSHLVARVEGEAVGKQIEADFWTWRGELIRHAKDVYVGVGGHRQDKAHIGTMKKLGLI